MTNQERIAAAVAAQTQKLKPESRLRYVAEDILLFAEGLPDAAAGIVADDLEAGTHTLKTCEKCIADYANKHRDGNVGVCPPKVVPKLFREHFGLGEMTDVPTPTPTPKKKINILDML